MSERLKELFAKYDKADEGHSPSRRADVADCVIDELREYVSDERLIELVEADKEGKIAVLPLKFDTDIYREGSSYSWQVSHYHVFPDEVVGFDDSDNAFTAKDIGVTVFTEPEAQAALTRKGPDNERNCYPQDR